MLSAQFALGLHCVFNQGNFIPKMATTVQRVFEYACDVAQTWHSHLNHFLLHTCVLLSVYLTKTSLANRAHTNGELEACWVNQPEAIFDCSWKHPVSMVHKDCLASRPPKHSRYGHANTHFKRSSVGTMTNDPRFLVSQKPLANKVLRFQLTLYYELICGSKT